MAAYRSAVWALGIAAVVVLGGVGAYALISQPSTTGRVSILVKDLPAEWTHVNVTFSEVKVHKADAGNESGWYNLTFATRTVDLAQLTNMSELLASGNVAAGKYTQIRIVVISANGLMTNGTAVEFKVPSGVLKTTHPFNVTAGHSETLTLDFDLSHSIVETSSGWTFKPVLGSITES